jgi:hypothetical protein
VIAIPLFYREGHSKDVTLFKGRINPREVWGNVTEVSKSVLALRIYLFIYLSPLLAKHGTVLKLTSSLLEPKYNIVTLMSIGHIYYFILVSTSNMIFGEWRFNGSGTVTIYLMSH